MWLTMVWSSALAVDSWLTELTLAKEDYIEFNIIKIIKILCIGTGSQREVPWTVNTTLECKTDISTQYVFLPLVLLPLIFFYTNSLSKLKQGFWIDSTIFLKPTEETCCL